MAAAGEPLIRIFWTIVFLCGSAVAQAQVVLGAKPEHVDRWPQVRVLVDPAGTLSPADAQVMKDKFAVPKGAYATLGLAGDALLAGFAEAALMVVGNDDIGPLSQRAARCRRTDTGAGRRRHDHHLAGKKSVSVDLFRNLCQAQPFTSRGRPSTRSAMMLRWISLEPP